MAGQKTPKSKPVLASLAIALAQLFLCYSPVFAQQASTSSLNYGFVSPNTREGLKLSDAVRGMYSDEESRLIKRAAGMRCVIRQPVRTTRAIGSWSDGAEHSILIRVHTDEPTVRYLMSRLGRDANQKAVIYFHPQIDGQAKIYIIYPSRQYRNFTRISRLLDASGIAFRTLVPTRKTTAVYIIDREANLARKVKNAAKKLRGRITTRTGIASVVGDDSVRLNGQQVFTQEINEYEANHPRLPPPCEVK